MMNRKDRRKQKEKKGKKKVIIYSVIAVIAVILFSIGFFVTSILNKVEVEKISDNDGDLGITEETKVKIESHNNANKVTNIALFGVDQRSKNERGRSDSIMVLSIDKAHNKLKLFSIMRDSYVNIANHGDDKIAHAYAFGGPQLAIRTLNENFGLNIKDFVTVNFEGLADIVDSLGGVTIDVKKAEVDVINSYIGVMASEQKIKADYLSKSGKQTLSGIQAVAYCRDRYTGNGDFERTERQRRVLMAIFDKVKGSSIPQFTAMLGKFLPYVNTSMSKIDMVSMGTEILAGGMSTLEQERFPSDEFSKGEIINKVWYLTFDRGKTKEQVFHYVFDDIKPTKKK